jgi:hypothetical protein
MFHKSSTTFGTCLFMYELYVKCTSNPALVLMPGGTEVVSARSVPVPSEM